MSKRNKRNTNTETTVMTATPATADAVLDNVDAIIASEGADIIEATEAAMVAATEPVVSEATLEAAVSEAEVKEMYAAVEPSAVEPSAVEPSAVVEAPTVTTPADATTTKKKAKAPAKPRLTFAKPAAKIAHILGEKLGETLVLDASWAGMDATALKAKQDETLAEVDKLAKKVGEKAVQLFSWMQKGGSLNEVMARGFKVLATDGFITSGDKGNVQVELSHKYSIGTTRSQANQLFCLFPALGITKRDGKGKQVLNPDSVIFQHVKATLFLGA